MSITDRTITKDNNILTKASTKSDEPRGYKKLKNNILLLKSKQILFKEEITQLKQNIDCIEIELDNIISTHSFDITIETKEPKTKSNYCDFLSIEKELSGLYKNIRNTVSANKSNEDVEVKDKQIDKCILF